MKSTKHNPIAKILKSLLAVALCLQLPLAVRADDASGLVPEAATIDSTPSGPTGVQGASDTNAKPQPEATPSETLTLHAQAVKKFDAGQTLSAEEYRSLEAGTVGFEANKPFFQDIAVVTVVYKDSPADKAGIRVGDKLFDNEAKEDEAAREDPTQPRQKVTCGKAGTPKDVTVLRGGKPVTLTLVRMNIEDIQETKYRHLWEQIVRRLGYPEEGSFSGTSLTNLTPAQ